MQGIPPLAEEILASDRCWEKKSQFGGPHVRARPTLRSSWTKPNKLKKVRGWEGIGGK